jgi:DNA-binding NtrC family response regulator
MAVDEERGGQQRPVWIVEDEPNVGQLAAEICESVGAMPTLFRAPLAYLLALRGSSMPEAVILDWRLATELSSGIFLATRHRYQGMPVIYWTNSPEGLPAVILQDDLTLVVDKQGGVEPLEQALGWAFEQQRPVRAQPSESM